MKSMWARAHVRCFNRTARRREACAYGKSARPARLRGLRPLPHGQGGQSVGEDRAADLDRLKQEVHGFGPRSRSQNIADKVLDIHHGGGMLLAGRDR